MTLKSRVTCSTALASQVSPEVPYIFIVIVIRPQLLTCYWCRYTAPYLEVLCLISLLPREKHKGMFVVNLFP